MALRLTMASRSGRGQRTQRGRDFWAGLKRARHIPQPNRGSGRLAQAQAKS